MKNNIIMGQSLVKNYVHIVFSTKHREALIHPPVEAELHSYLGGICNKLECQVLKVGGYTDHIHILQEDHPHETTGRAEITLF